MSEKKKAIRNTFRSDVFNRDKHRCRTCGVVPENGDEGLDAHHITDRTEITNGGYVKENGISLCGECHDKAEEFHRGNEVPLGFNPQQLYQLIGSSFEKAELASKRLKT